MDRLPFGGIEFLRTTDRSLPWEHLEKGRIAPMLSRHAAGAWCCLALRQQGLDHFPMNVGQAKVATLKLEGQLGVVDPHAV